jgi:hypothetical protein
MNTRSVSKKMVINDHSGRTQKYKSPHKWFSRFIHLLILAFVSKWSHIYWSDGIYMIHANNMQGSCTLQPLWFLWSLVYASSWVHNGFFCVTWHGKITTWKIRKNWMMVWCKWYEVNELVSKTIKNTSGSCAIARVILLVWLIREESENLWIGSKKLNTK